MRRLALVLIAAMVGSCTEAPPNPELAARQQAKLATLVAGKVAGPPMSCIEHYQTNDMITVDDNTVAFRQGSHRLYVNHMMGPCTGISYGHALITRSPEARLCRGDIAQVLDTGSRTIVGSCVFGDFVPYTRVG